MNVPSPAPAFPGRTVVVIPALDEAESVGNVVREWRRLGFDRVRVVDNGSRDATAKLAVAAGAEVLREPRRGYGAAAWRGLQSWPADREWILFSAADGSDALTPAELHAWDEAVRSGTDLAIGARREPPGVRSLSACQKIGNRISCLGIAWGWGRRFQDLGSLRLIRKSALERLHLADRGSGWNIEMQIRAVETGLRILEIPVVHRCRTGGRSKISGTVTGTIHAGWGILSMLAYLAAMRRSRRTRSLHDAASANAT